MAFSSEFPPEWRVYAFTADDATDDGVPRVPVVVALVPGMGECDSGVCAPMLLLDDDSCVVERRVFSSPKRDNRELDEDGRCSAGSAMG